MLCWRTVAVYVCIYADDSNQETIRELTCVFSGVKGEGRISSLHVAGSYVVNLYPYLSRL